MYIHIHHGVSSVCVNPRYSTKPHTLSLSLSHTHTHTHAAP
jgi:hypothetical protein